MMPKPFKSLSKNETNNANTESTVKAQALFAHAIDSLTRFSILRFVNLPLIFLLTCINAANMRESFESITLINWQFPS